MHLAIDTKGARTTSQVNATEYRITACHNSYDREKSAIANYFPRGSISQRHPPQKNNTGLRNGDTGNIDIKFDISSDSSSDKDTFD